MIKLINKCLLILLIIVLTGCQSPLGEDDKDTGKKFPVVIMLKNPINNTTIFDSTYIQAIIYNRRDRHVEILINNQLVYSQPKDTINYKWLVKGCPKYSQQNVVMRASYGKNDHYAGTASLTVTVTNSMVAFTSNKMGTNQLFIANDDGTKLTQITNVAGGAYFPAWSPKGDQIAYISRVGGNKFAIYIYDIILNTSTLAYEGGQNKSLTDLVWSPFKPSLVFAEDGAIVSYDIVTNTKTALFQTFPSRRPSFGNKKEILFEYYSGSNYLAVIDSNGNIFNIDAGALAGKLSTPVQRPGANVLYFYNKETKNLEYASITRSSGNWLLGAANVCASVADTATFAFSPNGRKIVFVNRNDKGIYITNYNGGIPQKVFTEGINSNPTWSLK